MGDVPVIQTAPYKISRLRLAYVAAEEYLRSFWFFAAAVPLGGLAFLLFGTGVLKIIGAFALMWPFSIPARAIMITSRAAKLFTTGVVMRLGEEEIEFLGTTPGAKGLPLRMAFPTGRIRDAVTRQGVLIVRTYRHDFAPVDPAAFATDADRKAFMRAIDRESDAPALETTPPDGRDPSSQP